MMGTIKLKLLSFCSILIFLVIWQVAAFSDVVPMATRCTKDNYPKIPPQNDEFDRKRLLRCYDKLWVRRDGTIFRSTSFEGWWLRCREEFADDDEARLACFIENNFWDQN